MQSAVGQQVAIPSRALANYGFNGNQEHSTVSSSVDKMTLHRSKISRSEDQLRIANKYNDMMNPLPGQGTSVWTKAASSMLSRSQPVKKQMSSPDLLRPEIDRQTMRELAAFLKSEDPSPANYMSIPDTSEQRSQGKSFFKIFQRSNSKRPSTVARHLQLPDSAVASKTTSGRWHIAISIPLEHDHPEDSWFPKSPMPPKEVVHSAASLHRGPITVLKPVMNNVDSVRRPKSRSIDVIRTANTIHQSEGKRLSSASSNVLGPEVTQTLQKFYRRENARLEQVSEARTIASLSINSEIGFTPVPATDISRQHGKRTDPRYSGGTIYSVQSLDSHFGHSRGVSSVSTAPSGSNSTLLRSIEPPSRFSSISRHEKLENSLDTPPATAGSSTGRESSDIHHLFVATSNSSEVSLGNIDIVDASYGYGPAEARGVLIRNVSRTPGPAPNRKLPDLPEGSDDSKSVKSRLGRTDSNVSSASRTQPKLKQSGQRVTRSNSQGSTQSRQDRVKALRVRDMHAFVKKAGVAKPASGLSETPLETTSVVNTASRNIKRRSISGSNRESARRRTANSLTPVMVVADLEPCSESYHMYDFVFPSPPSKCRKAKSSNNNGGSVTGAHTPPRSVTPSLASSDDETGTQLRRPYHKPTPMASQLGSPHRRVSRHSRSAREEELDARLTKIEENNAIMIQTLNTVVAMGANLQELNRLLPAR